MVKYTDHHAITKKPQYLRSIEKRKLRFAPIHDSTPLFQRLAEDFELGA